jgi:hypothetical protein
VSRDDGLFDEMPRFSRRRRAPAPLDDDTAARLIDGALDAGDAPPGYDTVVGVLAAAAAPPTAEELSGEPAAREAFATARQSGPPVRTTRRRGRAPALVASGLLIALLGGTAAAATGSLPGDLQGTAHDLLGGIGVDVPDRGHGAPDRSASGNGRSHGATPDATGSGDQTLTETAAAGLCNAYSSRSGRAQGTAFERLATAAAGTPGATDRERISAYCAGVTAHPPVPTEPPVVEPVPDPGSGSGNGGNSAGGTGNPANGNGNGGNSDGNANGGNAGGNANGGNAGGNGNANGGNAGGNGDGNGNGRP